VTHLFALQNLEDQPLHIPVKTGILAMMTCPIFSKIVSNFLPFRSLSYSKGVCRDRQMKNNRMLPWLCIALVASLILSCGSQNDTSGDTQTPPNVVTVPTQLNFFARPGTDPPEKELRIGVANRVAAKWSVHSEQSWLSIQPESGQLTRNTLNISVDSSSLPVGIYEASVSVDVEGTSKQVPVRLYVTTATPGQPLDAKVEQGRGNAWDAITLSGRPQATAALLDESLFVPQPGRNGLAYRSGDMVVLVTGTLLNNSDSEWQVDFWPEAFDAGGTQVAWGLDMGGAPLSGHQQMDVAARSSKPFSIHLTWADSIERITINSNLYDPATRLP
jgi:hypothetical protein